MLKRVRSSEQGQLALGLVFGMVFGFLLQKARVTNYEVVMGQLLLTDFTVLKVMLSAVVVGMLGVYFMRDRGWVRLHPKPGGWGMSLGGGVVFGLGFGLLGYCPGTLAGAVGEGHLDALLAGAVGMVLGAWLFAVAYPRLSHSRLLRWGFLGTRTLPQALGVNHWLVIVPVTVVIVALLAWLEGRL